MKTTTIIITLLPTTIILLPRDNNEKFLDAVGIVTGWGRLEYGGCHLIIIKVDNDHLKQISRKSQETVKQL